MKSEDTIYTMLWKLCFFADLIALCGRKKTGNDIYSSDKECDDVIYKWFGVD